MNEEPLSNAVEGGYNVNFYPLRLPGSVYGNYLLGGAIPASIPVVGVQPFAPNPYSMFALRGSGPKVEDYPDDSPRDVKKQKKATPPPESAKVPKDLRDDHIKNELGNPTLGRSRLMSFVQHSGKGKGKKKSLVNHVIKLLDF